MVKHYIPRNLQEALEILNQHDCYIMAGGTDLMVVKHQRSGLLPNFDKDVCYIANLEELQYIIENEEGIHIGAGTKYSDISEVTIGDNKDAFCATMLDKSEKVAEAKKDIEKYKAAGDEAKLQQAYLDLEHAKRLSNDAAGDFFDAVKSHVGQNTTVGQRYLKSATDAMKKVGISHDVKDIKFVKKAKNKVSTAKQEYTSRGSYSRQHPVDRGGK